MPTKAKKTAKKTTKKTAAKKTTKKVAPKKKATVKKGPAPVKAEAVISVNDQNVVVVDAVQTTQS
jgi:hypothetical protein